MKGNLTYSRIGKMARIHSACRRNNYGAALTRSREGGSRGAKWIFRRGRPLVTLDRGDETNQMPGGNPLTVQERPG